MFNPKLTYINPATGTTLRDLTYIKEICVLVHSDGFREEQDIESVDEIPEDAEFDSVYHATVIENGQPQVRIPMCLSTIRSNYQPL